jgi:ribosomal protein L29
MSDLYDRDFYAWASQQSDLLRAGKLSEADIANIAEEIATMGRSEKRELTSRLSVLLLHLLKWRFQPNLRSRSWDLTIREQRREVASVLADNPSLRATLDTVLSNAYGSALLAARRETGLPKAAFPASCPWTFDEAMREPEDNDDPDQGPSSLAE